MEWMILPLKRYAEFGGRSRRMEYWMFFLFNMLVGGVAGIIDSAVLGFSWESNGPVTTLVNLALFIPGLAVAVRRLHDTGRSGWWLLLIFAILIGWIVLFILLVTDGQNDENEYGPDPKMHQNIGDVFS